MMDADFRLWGTAKFSDIREFDFRGNGNLASAFFVVSFSSASVPRMISTIWLAD